MKTAYEKDMEDSLRQIAKAVGMESSTPQVERLIQKVQDLADDHSNCVCKGNWRTLVAQYRDLIGREYKDSKGKEYTFFGLVDGDDDYYYGMAPKDGSGVKLLSCVGSPEGFGYKLIGAEPKNRQGKPNAP